MTANERLARSGVGHAIWLTRYGRGEAQRMVALLNRADQDLVGRLVAALERIDADDFRMAGARDMSSALRRLDQQLADVYALNSEAYRQMGGEFRSSLNELVAAEATYQLQSIQSVLPAMVADAVVLNSIDVTRVHAAAMARPFQGKVLKDALSGIESARAERIRESVRMGFLQGQTNSQIIQRIRGTRALGYTDGLMNIDRRGAAALVRTATNHTATYARQALYEENSDLVSEWQFLATLDGCTTITCAGLSGKTFPIGQGPMPPLHWGCRSQPVPVLKSAWEALGVRQDQIPPRTQSSMNGYVSGDLTYSGWLRDQPAKIQDEVLGKTRADLFRKKRIDIDRFTDSEGNVYILGQLKRLDKELLAA